VLNGDRFRPPSYAAASGDLIVRFGRAMAATSVAVRGVRCRSLPAREREDGPAGWSKNGGNAVGEQTRLALRNFPRGGRRLADIPEFVRAYALHPQPGVSQAGLHPLGGDHRRDRLGHGAEDRQGRPPRRFGDGPPYEGVSTARRRGVRRHADALRPRRPGGSRERRTGDAGSSSNAASASRAARTRPVTPSPSQGTSNPPGRSGRVPPGPPAVGHAGPVADFEAGPKPSSAALIRRTGGAGSTGARTGRRSPRRVRTAGRQVAAPPRRRRSGPVRWSRRRPRPPGGGCG
jgi:hypothetical protein